MENTRGDIVVGEREVKIQFSYYPGCPEKYDKQAGHWLPSDGDEVECLRIWMEDWKDSKPYWRPIGINEDLWGEIREWAEDREDDMRQQALDEKRDREEG
jgi:hypothetical protein